MRSSKLYAGVKKRGLSAITIIVDGGEESLILMEDSGNLLMEDSTNILTE